MGQSDWNLLTAMKSLIAFSLFGLALGQVIEPRNTCGTIPSFMTGDRIVGGEAAASPIPWQVSVRQGQSGGGHFCGGTILDEKTVMCAAHCFTTLLPALPTGTPTVEHKLSLSPMEFGTLLCPT